MNYFQEYAKPKVLVHDSIFTTLDSDYTQADKRYFATLKNFSNNVEGVMFNTTPYKDVKQGEAYDKLFTDKYAVKNIEVNT